MKMQLPPSHATSVICNIRPELFLDWINKEVHQSSKHFLKIINQEAENIPIEVVREIKFDAQFVMGSDEQRELIFLWAEKISLPAQQALLKILEEPPKNTRIWLVTSQPTALLPTIHSRCTVISAKPDSNYSATSNEEIQVFSSSPAQLIELAKLPSPGKLLNIIAHQKIKREEGIIQVNLLIKNIHELPTSPSRTASLEALVEAGEWLNNNANVGLTLDNMVIKLWRAWQK